MGGLKGAPPGRKGHPLSPVIAPRPPSRFGRSFLCKGTTLDPASQHIDMARGSPKRAAARDNPAARPTSGKRAAAGAKQATKLTSSKAAAAATPGTATKPLAALLALSAADAGYEAAMATYGALGVVELRALCAGDGLGPSKNAKIPGCLGLIRNHALGNAAKAVAAAVAAAPALADKAQPVISALADKAQPVKAQPVIPLKRKRRTQADDAEDAAVVSSNGEDGGASLSATPVKAAGGGWPTIALLCQEGVITSRLTSALKSEACASVGCSATSTREPYVETATLVRIRSPLYMGFSCRSAS